MPLDPVKIGLAVQGGLAAVCATCTRWWEGQDRGQATCTAVDGCGSPLRGDDFHEYNGPLTSFERWCFRCGASSDYLVILADPGRRHVGVCRDHVAMFNELRPTTEETPRVYLQGGGALVRPEDLLPRRRRSLIASILEVEKHFADKEGREL